MSKMNKSTLAFIIALFISLALQGQDSKSIIEPIPLDKSALSGIGLKKIELKDEPEKDFYQKRLFWGKDIGVFVVGTETWNNKIENYPFDEFVYMFQGEAAVKPTLGSAQIFYSGDFFFAPRGFKGEWEIRAGDFIHYELSVITTTRADSSHVPINPQHQLFSKSRLSGNNISLDINGRYDEVLQKGAELTVRLKAESPSDYDLSLSTNERLIHVLSGIITLVDEDEKEHKFYTGDFFVIPRGFAGRWISQGHQVVKYLSIEKTIWSQH